MQCAAQYLVRRQPRQVSLIELKHDRNLVQVAPASAQVFPQTRQGTNVVCQPRLLRVDDKYDSDGFAKTLERRDDGLRSVDIGGGIEELRHSRAILE